MVSSKPVNHSPQDRTLIADPLGRFVFEQMQPYFVNSISGALTVASFSDTPNASRSGPIHPSGKFYYGRGFSDVSEIDAYTINAATGALTLASQTIIESEVGTPMVFDPTGRFAYVADRGLWMYSVNSMDGS